MNETPDRRHLLAAVLIAAGVLWLLTAVGFIPRPLVLTLLGLWPLLPIGIGLDLLIERKPFDTPFTLLALLMMTLLAFVLPNEAAFESQFVEPLDGAERLELQLELGDAPTTLRPLVGGDLFRADIVDPRDVRFRSAGGAQRRLTVAPGGGWRLGPMSGAPSPRWDLRVSSDVPVELEVEAGSGRVDLDLRGVELAALDFDGGSGVGRLLLPNTGSDYRVRVDLGSGSSEITTTAGAQLSIEAETGSGASSWTVARGTRLTLELDTGSGSVVVDLPDDASILLRIEDDGSGSVQIPAFLERLDGRGERGVWRSRGDTDREPDIVVVVDDAGSGSLLFR